ncbi:MAG: Spy/CpxP family protein refolding chaperone [Bryobacteraceae bacterium]
MKSLLLLSLTTASLVFAQDPAGPPRQGRANFAGRTGRMSQEDHLSKTLGLTAAQQQKVHEYLQDESVSSQGFGQKMRDQHAAMRDAIQRGASAEEIDRIALDGATAQAQVTAAHAKTLAKIYATLTDEQKKTFNEHPEMSMGFGGPMGPGGRGRMPAGAASQRMRNRTQQQD